MSQKGLILRDQKAEEIWGKEGFAIAGKAKSRWLAYFMAMRARIFDDWADRMLALHPDALVLHIGCGLDSRCLRVKEPYREWIDADFPKVIRQRSRYFAPTERYRMMGLDASKVDELQKLPQSPCAIVLLEGISMYLTAGQLHALLAFLHERYPAVYLLMDCYTEWAARASKYKNPVNEVGVTTLVRHRRPAVARRRNRHPGRGGAFPRPRPLGRRAAGMGTGLLPGCVPGKMGPQAVPAL